MNDLTFDMMNFNNIIRSKILPNLNSKEFNKLIEYLEILIKLIYII